MQHPSNSPPAKLLHVLLPMANTIIYHRCLASSHYPPIRFEKGKRLLWNRINAKTAVYRPEESVRLQYVDYLTLQIGFSPNRIATETGVPGAMSRGRTDILCYDKAFKPYLLVECKSENARINQAAANQSGAYNQLIKAPYILMTNGIQDAFFDVTNALKAMDTKQFPAPFKGKSFFVSYDSGYWIDRGFIHEYMNEETASWLTSYNALLFQASDLTRGYLNLTFPEDYMPLNHHYVFLTSKRYPDALYAVSFVALFAESTWFVAICNRKGNNMGCLRIPIEEDATFGEPELFRAGNSEMEHPDINGLERIFLDDEITVLEASGLYEKDEVELSILEAQSLSERISDVLDTVFFSE
ncbi:type I restriction enzyme HsdR N-terminal domain-containing protein [Balneolaceae bacterium ANBcel3]|nr:type I restriction enzyme HsdR N-terminal domain-containing protein [Balneolaceae bacterium ANBcel3]